MVPGSTIQGKCIAGSNISPDRTQVLSSQTIAAVLLILHLPQKLLLDQEYQLSNLQVLGT